MPSIHEATLRRDAEHVSMLISAGEDVNARDQDGRTPLMQAAIDGDTNIVELLLASGADPDMQDNNGWTALHFTAQECLPAVAQLLIGYHATVDIIDNFGNTPLWRAVFASRGRGELIKLLLNVGADRALRNKSGVSPEELAGTIGNYDVRRFFGH